MLGNYLKIALRNLINHKMFSLINITGLSIGITCCVLLSLYIHDEFAFETHFKDYKNIYRLTTVFNTDQGAEKFPRSSPPIAMTLAREVPEIESATRVVNPPEVEQHLIRLDDQSFYEKTGYLVDSTFFDVFSYEFREGDPKTALDGRSAVVLSDVLARKIFGHESALEHTLIINSGQSVDTFHVTGVLKPFTSQSQVDADFYMGMNSHGWGDYINGVTTWAGQNFIYTYLKLRNGTPPEAVTDKFPALLDKYGAKDLKEMGIRKSMGLQRLADVHLYSVGEFGGTFSGYGYFDLGATGNIMYVYVMGSICLFILLLACINFMNLTTAKASQRAGEVGVRKSLGASRRNLVRQFLGESMTIVALAMIVSLGLVQVVLPLFNEFTHKQLSITANNFGYIAGALVAITVITGLVAGSYPAFFLSSFQPARVLKNRYSSTSSQRLRKVLVIFQFVISISLISSIALIQQQMNYIKSKALGFNPSYRIMLPLRTTEAKSQYVALRNRLKGIAGVHDVAGTTALPSTATVRDLPLYPEGSNMDKSVLHFNINVDDDYFKLLEIPLIAGRTLTYEKDSVNFFGSNHNRAMVNRESLRRTGIALDNAVGSHLFIDWQGRHIDFEIVGVIDDFHQFSLHQKMTPMIFLTLNEQTSFAQMVVSIEPSDYKNVIGNIEKVWRETVPNTPFESDMLSDNVKRQYDADEKIFGIITASTLTAILISCLGLYGLSIYVAERRLKEIGIRKVLGASIPGIVGLLSREFVILVAIAFVVSVPVVYYAMGRWLEGFEFRTSMGFGVFVTAAAVSFVIAWLTVGFESLRAAFRNPVDSLRTE